MQAPPIDKRKYGELVAETEELAQQYSQWRPGPQTDAGGALIRIFGRFLELIIARLNRVPEKNFLAFLNLIGTEPLPPQPARVALTFHTAANGPLDTTVPAGTQAAAPPLEGEEDEVVFETERDLVATRAQLKAVFTRDTETDRYAERSKQESGELDEAFLAFAGDKPVPHELYLACDEVLAQPGEKDVMLIITSADTWQWEWPIEWSYGDGEGWQAREPGKTEVKAGAWRVAFGKLPPLAPMTVNGVEAGWLRARLTIPLPAAKTDLAPESVASGGAAPTDLVLPYYPFGEVASVARFYLSADEAFRAGGAVAHLKVTLAKPGKARKADLRLTWSFFQKSKKTKDDWVELGQSGPGAPSSGATGFGFSDSTLAFTQDGEVSFRVPVGWERSLYRNRTGRWIRVDIVNEQYSSLPQIGKLTAGYEWRLPSVTQISLKREGGPLSLLPDLAFVNGAAIDLSKDFYPFGEQPRYNDVFYLACEKALARPGAKVNVKVTLTNPVGAKDPPVPAVTTEGGPTIAWEAWNGRAWEELKAETIAKNAKSGTPGTFTGSEGLDLTLPQTMAPVAVNGEERHWLRARLAGGHFGEAAGYTEDKITVSGVEIPIYKPKAASYKPPVVKSVEFPDIAAGANEVAVSVCLGHNDLAYEDHTAAAVAGINFSPFTVAEDTRPALYLGLDRPFDPRPATIYLQVEPPDPHEVAAERLAEIPPEAQAQVTWEYWGLAGWTPLAALDETQTLARPDLVQFIAPEDLKPRPLFGQALCWLRARWRSGKFPVLPRLRRVLLNTTWASQVTTSRQENLGSSNGNADQAFQSAQSPVLPGQQLEVREPELPGAAERRALERLEGPDAITVTLDSAGQPDETWVRWHQVADFYASHPRDRHYTIDALSGRILFGDGQRGLVPLPGQNNIRLTYRSGGGAQGNRAAGSIVQLKSTVPYIEGATNPEPASGGAPREPIERVAARGPCWLRHRDRSVTAQDLEDLAFDADPSVARARAILPSFDPLALWLDPPAAKAPDLSKHEKVDAGRMGMVLVPRGDAKRPVASLGLLRRVKGHLASRSPVTADLWVAGPEWVEVTVAATVVPASLAVADAVLSRVTAALDGFLHPLTGGREGQGWPFARIPHASDLYAVIEAVAGVDHVRVLKVSNEPQITQAEDESLMNALRKRLNQPLEDAARQTPDPAVERWLGRSLVYSGRHHILLALEGG